MSAPTHVYEIFVKASPRRVWQAITDPDYTRRYFHRTAIESTFEPGAGYRYVMADGRDAVEGTIEEVDAERRLVMTWRTLYDAALAEEPVSRVEWTLTPANDDATVTRVTLRHLDLARSPGTWASVRLGWVGVLDSMKTLLETGDELGDVDTYDVDTGDRPAGQVSASDEVDGGWHRAQAIAANNSTWELLDGRSHSPDERDDLLARAYASTYHWARAAGRTPANAARGSWLVSRTHAVLGDGELALHHADQCAATCAAAGLDDFDLAYAFEARARALACLGRLDEARIERKTAGAVDIVGAEDRSIFESDLAAEPWFGLSDD